MVRVTCLAYFCSVGGSIRVCAATARLWKLRRLFSAGVSGGATGSVLQVLPALHRRSRSSLRMARAMCGAPQSTSVCAAVVIAASDYSCWHRRRRHWVARVTRLGFDCYEATSRAAGWDPAAGLCSAWFGLGSLRLAIASLASGPVGQWCDMVTASPFICRYQPCRHDLALCSKSSQ